MRPQFILLFVLQCLVFAACGQDLLPFGTDFAPSLSFTENYTDTVYFDTDLQDYDTVPNTTLIIDGHASMKGVDPTDFDDDASFNIDFNDLSVEFDFEDGTRTTANGRTTVQWDVIGTDPISFDDVKIGTAFVRWTATEIVFHLEAGDDPDDYSVIAPDYAGTVDSLDQYPLVLTLSVGDYGLDSRVVYVSGTADLYDKTVGSGDNQETFTDLAKVMFKGFIDSSKPSVAIVNPASHQVVNDMPYTIAGTCADNVSVATVEVQVNGGDWVPATVDGSGGWSLAGVKLAVGNNTVTARATDDDGNVQVTGKRTFKFSETSPLTVTAAGDSAGRVTAAFFPPLVYTPGTPSPVSTTDHQFGALLTLTAVPGPNAVFDGWTSDKTLTPQQAASAVLKIKMESNMSLTAHFLTNPFTPVQGSYRGLVTGSTLASRGIFTAKLGSRGAFTGTIKIGGLSFILKGKFSNTGHYTTTITKGGVPYVIDLTLNISGTGALIVTGTVQGGAIDATVNADLAIYNSHNHAPQVGTYHLLIPPASGNADPNYPVGIGFGRLTVSALGSVSLVGQFADGTPLMSGGSLFGTGMWSLFASLYKNKGTISGLVTFDLTDPAHDLNGQADWYRPTGAPPAHVHPEGFSGKSDVVGAKWIKPAPGTLVFLGASGGGGTFSVDAPANGALPALASDLPATLTGNTLAVNFGVDPVQTVKVSINAKNGGLAGSFVNAGQKYPFSGLILAPKVNAAGGRFVWGARTGSVQVVATP